MIKYGISELSIIAVRKEPSEKSEMTTQLLFGETFQILEEVEKWCYVKITFDSYEGWIDNKTVSFISEDVFIQINSNSEISAQNLSTIVLLRGEQILVPAGSTFPNYNKASGTFMINKNNYQLTESYTDYSNDIKSLLMQYVNCPYLWGGKNPFGIDCSGLVQVVYKTLGMKLPRDASQQVKQGNTVSFISEAKPGDLAFFDDDEGNIVHVGILLNAHEIIHSSGKVRIDTIDQQGINNIELKKYTHKLRVIKRII
jgi:cell wall-associated NlpC family hydrolase